MTKNIVCDWERLPLVLNVETVCLLLGCTRQLVVRMIKAGELKAKKVGREWRIPKESVKEFFEV